MSGPSRGPSAAGWAVAGALTALSVTAAAQWLLHAVAG